MRHSPNDFKMLKLGILLDACGIKATPDQAQKLESFVNFWLKKHYVSKENQKSEKSDKADTEEKENQFRTDAETQTEEEISENVC